MRAGGESVAWVIVAFLEGAGGVASHLVQIITDKRASRQRPTAKLGNAALL